MVIHNNNNNDNNNDNDNDNDIYREGHLFRLP